MPAVRAEYGPTLPELVIPRLRALPRLGRIAVAVAAALVVVLVIAALVARGSSGDTPVVVQQPIAYNLRYGADALRQVAPPRGATLQLVTRPGRPLERMTVTPFRLGAYQGDPTAVLMMMVPRMIDDLRATVPGFALRGEGRTRVNDAPGYQLQYQARIGGRTTYVRRVLLVPQTATVPQPREGTQIDVVSTRTPAVANVDLVGNNGQLKKPFRSFRFGTNAP